MLKVLPILSEPLRFRVQSEANPRRYYLVELGSRVTSCDCMHYQTRIGPLLKNDYQTKEPRLCKHGVAALATFAMQMVGRIEREYASRRK